MAKKHRPGFDRQAQVAGAEMLRRVFPLFAGLARAGTQRDKAGNRKLLFSQYAALVLIGMFNPVLQSARGLVAASGIKRVRKLTGGSRTSLGSFSEASSVFKPALLEGIVAQLRSEVRERRHLGRITTLGQPGDLPNKLIDRLIAVDGSVLTALPQIVGRLGTRQSGQWRLHVQVHVSDDTVANLRLTPEPAAPGDGERDVLARSLTPRELQVADSTTGQLYLLDRGYRSAALFNRIHQAGHDYVCRLNRLDGRVCATSPLDEQGQSLQLPLLSDAARELGVVADEFITLGGQCGASPIGSDHALRRITLVPPADRSSSARQGRVRTDQTGREQLILATTLLDLPAEQIVKLYEYRWQVELFFRFLKHMLKCNTLLSAKTNGVEIQLYCAIIASLLMALVTGRNITRRQYEMICLYFSGWADEEELQAALQKPPP